MPPQIDFCFEGWIKGAKVYFAHEVESGKIIDVSKMSSSELAKKLNTGELLIDLGSYFDDGSCQEEVVQLRDFLPFLS
jgi:hypothetical protein